MLTRFETVVANVAGKVRHASLFGRPHLVANARMMVEGVHKAVNIDAGVYYPKERMSQMPGVWNGFDAVLFHPVANGEYISARDPDILENRGIGKLFRTKWNGALDAEVYIDVARANERDERVVANMEAGNPIELSAALLVNAVEEAGEFNGTPYKYKLIDYIPDHLAILPDGTGACSVEKGCGLLVANCACQDADKPAIETWTARYGTDQRRTLAANGVALNDGSFPVADADDLAAAVKAFSRAAGKTAVRRHLVNRAAALKLTDLLPPEWLEKAILIVNQQSLDDRISAVRAALYQRFTQPGYSWNGYVEEVYSDFVVFCTRDEDWNTKTYKVNYRMDGENAVLDGDPVPVERVVTYRTVANEFVADARGWTFNLLPGESKMAGKFNREEHVKALVANNGFTAEELKPLPDAVIEKIEVKKAATPPAVPAVVPAVVANTETPAKKMSLKDILANSDEETQEVLGEMLQGRANARGSFIARILAANTSGFSKEDLEAMGTRVLKGMAAMVPAAAGDPNVLNLPPNYLGAGGAAPVVANTEVTETPLIAPMPFDMPKDADKDKTAAA